MYLFDSNILIWVLRKNKTYINLYQSLKHTTLVSISTITIAEIYKNVLPGEVSDTEALIADFALWEVTSPVAKQAGLYWQQYQKRIQNLNILDCILAATAKEHELMLVTLNVKHFPMNDIRIFRSKKL